VAIDPFRGYANGVATHLSHATVVVDPFTPSPSPTGPSTTSAGGCRTGRWATRGRSGDPLYGIRRLLLATERHTESSRARLEACLATGDPRDEVPDALVTDKRPSVTSTRPPTSARPPASSTRSSPSARPRRVPELSRLARTAGRWRTEILAHHTTGASNGPTEAVNLVVKKVVRVAHGFRNFDNYLLRVASPLLSIPRLAGHLH
jgi:transposase